MTATQKHDIIPICTTVLSADQPPKEDIMLDQQKITILYCRLSNEDAQEGESNSIANQREYLTRYARDHGYTNLKILVDDGYTGTNFNRPGVQEGFELVKQGLVGCWLVKDLSRFGRDYLTVGQYTDIIFPSYLFVYLHSRNGACGLFGPSGNRRGRYGNEDPSRTSDGDRRDRFPAGYYGQSDIGGYGSHA